MEQYKQEFIEFMVESGVLKFGEFTTKSGRQTPFFINTGNYCTGEQLLKLGEYYAASMNAHCGTSFDILYGPAYKGIPLAVTAAVALARTYNHNVKYCFNRKEAKDHGEGGVIVGYTPKHGDKVIIIEDVVTAGTSVRETIPLLKKVADVSIVSLIVSVDRMERGTGEKSALQEVRDDYEINAFAIVTIDEVVAHLHNRTINGTVVLTDAIKAKIDAYRAMYGVK